jgi:hypothetical protein
MGSVLRYDEVDMNQINYSKPEKVGTSYFGSLSYGEHLKPFYIQTPKVKSKINIKDVEDKKIPYLDIEIPNGNFDIYDFFLNIDDKNIKTTFQKSQEWFNKELPLEAIDDMYKRSTKPFKKNENPTLRFRLPVVKNKIQCGVYNQQRVFVDINEIKNDSEIILILHIRGLKVLKQNFYCDCYVSQIKLFQDKDTKYNIIPEYAMVDEKEEDDDIFDEEIIQSIISKKEKEKSVNKERIEQEKVEEQEKERIENENKRIEQERIEQERIENEKVEEQEKADKEEQEKADKEEQEKADKEEKEEKEEKERMENERMEKIKQEIESKRKEMEELMLKLN